MDIHGVDRDSEGNLITRPIFDIFDEIDNKRKNASVWKKIFIYKGYCPLRRFWSDYNPMMLYRMTKWFLQRGKRGWADCDTWSLDSYLCSWMPEALEYLKNSTHGYPGSLNNEDDYIDYYSLSEEEQKAYNQKSQDRMDQWKGILDHIGEAFRAHERLQGYMSAYEDQIGEFPDRKAFPDKDCFSEAIEQWNEKMFKCRDIDKEIYNEGMALFVKHFGSLWD